MPCVGLLVESLRLKTDNTSMSTFGLRELLFPKKEKKMKPSLITTVTLMKRVPVNGRYVLLMNGSPLRSFNSLNC